MFVFRFPLRAMFTRRSTSVLISYTFSLVLCRAFISPCNPTLELDSQFDHQNECISVVVVCENCEWPRSFSHLYSNPKDVGALRVSNLSTHNSSADASLTKGYFSGMDYLRLVNITDSQIGRVEGDAFEELMKLEVINLNDNRIVDVPERLFRMCRKLKELHLSGNQIKRLPDLALSTNTILSILDLSHNSLEIINSTELFAKTKLKYLYLQGNRISTIYKNTFTELNSLEFLNISYNMMSFSASPNCNNKSEVYYPQNYIWLGDMVVKTNSCVIDFSHNQISGLPLSGIHSTCNTHIHNRCKQLTLLLDGNPLSCDCTGYDLIRYFRQEWPSNVMQAVRISDERTCTYAQNGSISLLSEVNIECIYCSLNECPNCPSECSCQLRKHTNTLLVNCSRRSLETFPRNLPITRDVKSEFWLKYNRISSIGGIEYPYQVQVLALSHNRIRELPPNFSRFTNLKVLELRDNDLRILTPDHVKHIIMLNLNYLTLGNNPWNCSDCRIISFVKYLRNSSNVISDRKSVFCADRQQLVAELDLDMCKALPANIFILVASFLCLLVLAMMLLLWYKIRREMFVNLFNKTEDGERKVYDAFISYAHQDEMFVVGLVRYLEARKNPFKICVHSRDWVPGEFIVKQMADSVNNSRASVIVLSAAYFRSKWCYSEFRIALTQMLVRRNHKVIVIWLSDEDPSAGKLDPDVRLYFSTCTYLKYDDERFLNKLELALQKRRKTMPEIE